MTTETQTSRVVFPSRHGSLDFSGGAEYGAVKFATDANNSPYHTEDFIDTLSEYLDEIDFDAANDYIGLSGSTLGVSLLLATAVAQFGRIRVLIYEQKSARFVVREVSIPE